MMKTLRIGLIEW